MSTSTDTPEQTQHIAEQGEPLGHEWDLPTQRQLLRHEWDILGAPLSPTCLLPTVTSKQMHTRNHTHLDALKLLYVPQTGGPWASVQTQASSNRDVHDD